MKAKLPALVTALMVTLVFNVHAAVRYVDLNCPNPTPPFLDWSTAATNIQDAIDAAVEGDQILVTNGVYQTGGKVMAGDLTNRVALDKAVTVQSVNGPWVTRILGPGNVSSFTAVRCAWLTNGAALVGFTLQGGGTRSSGDSTNLQSGGGVWCAASSAVVANCMIISNTAFYYGGGVFQGTIRNSLILGNGWPQGGAAYGASLNNCTVLSNNFYAAYLSQLTNCIVYYNGSDKNYSSCTLFYCCTTPLPAGLGNFSTPPQLFSDGVHLTSSSPCIGAGTNLTVGMDLFGNTWSNPPSVGCAEWQSTPTIVTQPRLQTTGAPKGFTAGNAGIVGQPPYTYEWLKDGALLQDDGHFSGTQTPNLVATGLSYADAGNYQLVVSNALGAVTSSVAPLVVHCVDAASANPTPPYMTWATAAATIQDAITAAALNEVVLVTNGLYATGGKSMEGILTNRVCVDKALLVASVNGPFVTTIQGAWDPVSTNGPGAVRGAWLTNGAALVGFTVQGGATRATGDRWSMESGGGVWCASSNALVANCRILSNAAYFAGGGVYQGTVRNSLLAGNTAANQGTGVSGANLNNCTVVSNYWWRAYAYSYAAEECQLTNCIVYYNNNGPGYNYGWSVLSYCCTTPAPAGKGNFAAAPQLFSDSVHLAVTSPCLGAGTNLAVGTDILGRAWANPPSVGCAERDPDPRVAQPQIQVSGAPAGVAINAAIVGQPPFACWWLKDGVPLQDNGHLSFTQTTNLVVSGMSYADAGSYQLVVSNAFGMVTSAVARLVVHCVDAGSANPVPPYSTWATAAATIQDAITAALPNEVVLVTNGLYATGGKSMDGVLTNRVSVDKAILVQSVNGPYVTTIQGAWDPVSTNGAAAVRCVWLTNNAVLSGFTLVGGATRSFGASHASNGGGIWGASSSATVDHCLVLSNCTAYMGGGAYQVTLNNSTLMGNHGLSSNGGGGGGAANCNLKNCVVLGNVTDQTSGGGAWNCNLANCSVMKNSSSVNGGAVQGGTLINCTVTGNTSSGYGGAVYGAALTNCIVWGNLQRTSYSDTNYASCTLAYCCTEPLASGPGNIAVGPQLLGDGVHLAQTSPCRGAGTNSVVVGIDMDGQAWSTPPSIGCDEWQPVPVFVLQPSYRVNPALRRLDFSVTVAGQPPFSYFWSKDGVLIQDDSRYSHFTTEHPSVSQFGFEDAGGYQVVVSNAFGMVTSQVAQVVVHAVDAASAHPVPPYTSWATAAATIQDAINASSAGDLVWVTNGIYASGGKVMVGDLTNRVALDKPLTVMSVNGPFATVIEGAWDSASTNGPGAVRCAWLTSGALLHGFTLRNGATRALTGLSSPLTATGGGIWCSSTDALVSNCVLSNNSAVQGGGISSGSLNNSLVVGNFASWAGGGAVAAVLNNCTVVGNTTLAGSMFIDGAGTCRCWVRNSIVSGNFYGPPSYLLDNDHLSQYSYSYTEPGKPGTGNLSGLGVGSQWLDLFHLAVTSPCRGAGNPLYASGVDLDGEPWANPPSMGCDEVVLANLVGPLSVSLRASQTNMLVSPANLVPPHYDYLLGTIAGRATRVEWNFGDGPAVTNWGTSVSKGWTNPGDYPVTFTAFNLDNPDGVSTNLLVHVTAPRPPQLQALTLDSTKLSFQFTGELTAHYTVQYTTNLVPPVVWQTLQSYYSSPDKVYQITDPVLTNGARFYRVLAQ